MCDLTKVECVDGAAGVLAQVVTDPDSRRPAYVVVKHGRPKGREAVVPVSLVSDISPDRVRLDVSREALRAHIAQQPGCRLKELALGLGVSSPTVSVAVRHLEDKGLVGRQSDPEDRRAVQLFLTPQGKSLNRRAESFRKEKARRLLAGLASEDRSALLKLLQRALDAAERDGASARG